MLPICFPPLCCVASLQPKPVSTFLTENHNYLKYSVYWQLGKNPNGPECIFEEKESFYNFYILVQVQLRCFILQCQVFRRRILRCYLASSFVSSLDVKQIGIQGPSTCLFFNTLYSPLSIMGLDVSCPWVVTSWAYQKPNWSKPNVDISFWVLIMSSLLNSFFHWNLIS